MNYSDKLNKYTPRWQHEARDKNMDSIMIALSKEPQRFGDLLEMLPISHTALWDLLIKLRKEGSVEKIIHNDRDAYSLTEKGRIKFQKIILLIDTLTQIRKNDGGYLCGAVPTVPKEKEPLTWPSSMHLASDKTISKISDIIPLQFLLILQKNIISELSYNILKKGISLESKKDGKIVLAIEIDYKDLLRSIKERSLEKWKKLWNKEMEFNLLFYADSLSGGKPINIRNYKLKEKLT